MKADNQVISSIKKIPESIKTGVLHAGTSNIVLPGTKKTFPEAFRSSSRLTYYASLFNTVEINSSFYKVPLPVTFERWSAEVPATFQFSVKLWRNITHAKALAYQLSDIDFFMHAANQVADNKKGCLLIQFPKSITIEQLHKIKSLLKRVSASNSHWRICVEFRHTSWYTAQVYAMLDTYHSSLVLHDMPSSAIADHALKAGFVYLRFHGINGDYKGSYSPAELQVYASKINQWLQQGKEVYAYFNNTIGSAFDNTQSLAEMVKQMRDEV